jgi:trans-2,3-dihydro-3-hydroxyanthranilate isomerase
LASRSGKQAQEVKDNMANPRMFIVDVFAEEKYAGNQLAVVAGGAALSSAAMQRIARETNFSETTFILSDQPQNGGYAVRIFTPAAEIPFAGHPTLGTAFVLRTEILNDRPETVTLNLGVGQVPVRFTRDGDGRETVWMRAPQVELGQTHAPEQVAAIIGLSAGDLDSRFPVQDASIGISFTIIPVATLDAMKRARFNRTVYDRQADARHAVFLFSSQTYSGDNQINARMFAEPFGVPEDPATGSANACLGAYLLEHRYAAGDRLDVRVEQGYEIGRPSLLFLRAQRHAAGTEVFVGGHVVTAFRGELL